MKMGGKMKAKGMKKGGKMYALGGALKKLSKGERIKKSKEALEKSIAKGMQKGGKMMAKGRKSGGKMKSKGGVKGNMGLFGRK